MEWFSSLAPNPGSLVVVWCSTFTVMHHRPTQQIQIFSDSILLRFNDSQRWVISFGRLQKKTALTLKGYNIHTERPMLLNYDKSSLPNTFPASHISTNVQHGHCCNPDRPFIYVLTL